MEAPNKPDPMQKLRAACALACFLGGLFMTAIGGYFVWKGQETAAWATAPGQVEISRMETVLSRTAGKSGSTLVDVAKIEYVFEVAGRGHRGDRVSTFDLRVGRNTERARALLEQYPVGRVVEVHYDPTDPERAVLEAGARPGAWKLVGVGVGVLLLYFVLGAAAGPTRREA